MLYLVFSTKSLVSILSTFANNLLYKVFLTTSFFTTLLNLLKSARIRTNLPMSNLSTLVFRLAELVFNATLVYQRVSSINVRNIFNICFCCIIT